MTLLVFAESNDPVACGVLAAAARTGLDTIRVGPAELGSLGACCELPGPARSYFTFGQKRIDTSELTGVLVRWLPATESRGAIETDRQYLLGEWNAALLGILRALPCPVVNPPKPLSSSNSPRSIFHPADLHTAGLRSPHLFVTTSEKAGRHFAERHPLPVEHLSRQGTSRPDYLVAAPEGVRRRIFVVGDHVCEASTSGPDEALAKCCLAVVRRFHLLFAELILVSNPDGHTLLELSDRPSFDGCPEALRTCVAGALVDLLAGVRSIAEVGA